jgi:hypothetical protein
MGLLPLAHCVAVLFLFTG